MSVHQAISQHSQKQHAHIEKFYALDQQREWLIEQAVELCLRNEPFTVDLINQTTLEINELAKKGITPVRKLITTQMLSDYANKLK